MTTSNKTITVEIKVNEEQLKKVRGETVGEEANEETLNQMIDAEFQWLAQSGITLENIKEN